MDEELEDELQAESDEEVEYVEADSDLEAELESESDIEDMQVGPEKASHSKSVNSSRRKQQLEIEYEKESLEKLN